MTELRTQGDPVAVAFEAVVEALAVLGIHEWEDVREVVIERNRVIVTRLRRDEEGHWIAAGDQAATTTNVIAVRKGMS